MIVICVAFASETVHDPFRLDTVIEPNNQVAVVTKNNKIVFNYSINTVLINGDKYRAVISHNKKIIGIIQKGEKIVLPDNSSWKVLNIKPWSVELEDIKGQELQIKVGKKQ